MEYKLCFMGYGKLTEIGNEAIRRLHYQDTEIKVIECTVDDMSGPVNAAISEGYEIFIGGSANAAEFVRTVDQHLIEIPTLYSDYVHAVKKALKLGRHPVVAVYMHSKMIDLSELSELIGTEIEIIRYEDGHELLSRIRNSKADVIIGASHANQAALNAGKQSVLLYPGVEAVMSAIEQARNFAAELYNDRRTNAVLRSIINNSTFGLIVSDTDNRIIMFNTAAQKMTGINAREARGQNISRLFPTLNTADFLRHTEDRRDEYHLINDTMFRCSQSRIIASGETVGILTILNQDTRSRRHNQANTPKSNQTVLHTFDDLKYTSPAVRSLIEQARNYARTPHNLLILGEESTHREVIAQCIHTASSYSQGPYIRIDLSALGSSDPGQFLLGYDEHGEHTAGLLEQANHGTAVLEHLADASINVTNILITVMNTHTIRPLGSDHGIPADIRFITILSEEELGRIPASHQSRLGIFRVHVPSLRERKEDLFDLFLNHLNKLSDIKTKHRSITPEMKTLLEFYSWPGNLVELRVAAERYLYAVSSANKATAGMRYKNLVSAIGEDNLFRDITARYPFLLTPDTADPAQFREAVEKTKDLLGYNNDQIADRLGISRTTLWRYLKEA
ncbi:MAG: PrpR N-terminal domain-containing protein [Solobacterium sp.]|nr:PrpR N-terminal domain-containing protein [Solobacterium sp.]